MWATIHPPDIGQAFDKGLVFVPFCFSTLNRSSDMAVHMRTPQVMGQVDLTNDAMIHKMDRAASWGLASGRIHVMLQVNA